MIFRRIGIIVGAWLMCLAAPDQGQAQENFPNRPIRIVIPYSPGSVTDVFARIIAQNMQEQWKGSIVVESKSGANGSIAAEEVARAAPDGYTWLLVTTFFTASPSLNAAPALGSGARFRSDRSGVPRAEFFRGPDRTAGKQRGRICRPREGQAGHPELQPSRARARPGISALSCSSGWLTST